MISTTCAIHGWEMVQKIDLFDFSQKQSARKL